MSGRFCSIAWPVFFTRGGAPLQEAVDRAVAEDVTAFGQSRAQLLDRDIAYLFEKGQDRRGLRFHPSRTPVPAPADRMDQGSAPMEIPSPIQSGGITL